MKTQIAPTQDNHTRHETLNPVSPFRIVIVGHVDHGKSTLVGRLFHDTGSLPDGKLEALQQSCQKRGIPFEWAFLMDAFQAERSQNITIDTAQIWFHTQKRPYVIIDAPGHKEFLKNMITGAAEADAALLLVAADEGIQEQSQRHAYLLSLLGIDQVVVVVNKMDLVDSPEERFQSIQTELNGYLKTLGVHPMAYIPASARNGDQIAVKSNRYPWYHGPTVIESLDRFKNSDESDEGTLLFGVQDVYRFDRRRIIAGRVDGGKLQVGDTIRFEPGRRESRVKTIERWQSKADGPGQKGESIGITLEEQIFVERGQVGSQKGGGIGVTTDVVPARVFWLADEPLQLGQEIRVKIGTQESLGRLSRIHRVIDASTLASRSENLTIIQKSEIADLEIRLEKPIFVAKHAQTNAYARTVLVVDGRVGGGGPVLLEHIQSTSSKTGQVSVQGKGARSDRSTEKRLILSPQRGGILWFSGQAEKREFALASARNALSEGIPTVVLDGAGGEESVDLTHTQLLRVGEHLSGQGYLVVLVSHDDVVPLLPDHQRLLHVRVTSGPNEQKGYIGFDPAIDDLDEARRRLLALVRTQLQTPEGEWTYAI